VKIDISLDIIAREMYNRVGKAVLMKIVLVFPGIANLGFNSFGSPAFEYTGSEIHHGLCSLSACAKQAGYEVELIDLRGLRGWGHYRQQVQQLEPDVMGITSMSLDYDIARRCAQIAREVSPRVVIVIGGIHPTVATEQVLAEPAFDHVVVGEGEISFVNLLRKLEAGQIPGRLIQDGRPDLDALPFVDRELFDYSAELNAPFLGEVFGFKAPYVTIITSRGCMYNCSFCQPAERKLFGRLVRRRSVPNVMAELRVLRDRYDFRSLKIHDDSVTQDVEWVTDFCNAYVDQGFTQPFFASSRADFICNHEETFALLARAGLAAVSIGFESGNDRVLRKLLHKGVTVEQNLRAAKICRKYGVKILGSYMMGIPGETKEEVMDTVRMIQAIRPDHHMCSFFTPLPGTHLFEMCQEQNLCLFSEGDQLDRGMLTPKIRGVDYDFLLWAAEEAQNLPRAKRILRRIARQPWGRRLRQTLMRVPVCRELLIHLRRLIRA
jgi:anaerobic magnesium-protoporphyrin IX monomethyl ester cyclase